MLALLRYHKKKGGGRVTYLNKFLQSLWRLPDKGLSNATVAFPNNKVRKVEVKQI
jgi:hypothetical protein